MTQRAMIINYEFCTGCRTCEVACQQEHGYDPEKTGIALYSQGPFQIEGKRWNWNWIPTLTDLCDGCATRVAKGKLPACQHHCQARVIKVGAVDDLASDMGPKHVMLAIPRA